VDVPTGTQVDGGPRVVSISSQGVEYIELCEATAERVDCARVREGGPRPQRSKRREGLGELDLRSARLPARLLQLRAQGLRSPTSYLGHIDRSCAR
jgi:hypothetical protein